MANLDKPLMPRVLETSVLNLYPKNLFSKLAPLLLAFFFLGVLTQTTHLHNEADHSLKTPCQLCLSGTNFLGLQTPQHEAPALNFYTERNHVSTAQVFVSYLSLVDNLTRAPPFS